MNEDDILRMAREVGPLTKGPFDAWCKRFANLVAAAEREDCAEVCKKHADVYEKIEQNPTAKSAWAACIDNRDAIRARKNT